MWLRRHHEDRRVFCNYSNDWGTVGSLRNEGPAADNGGLRYGAGNEGISD